MYVFFSLNFILKLPFIMSYLFQQVYSDGVGWSQVPKLWPCLESLEVGQATGLTMDIVSEFIPKMPKIRRIL